MTSPKFAILSGIAALLMASPALAEAPGAAQISPPVETTPAYPLVYPAAQDAPVRTDAAPIVSASQATPVAAVSPAPVVRASRLLNARLLNDSELDAQRGGEALVITNQTLTAITQGNVLNGGFVAGNVSLSDSALSSFNGVGNILINTGAQVSLQTGMNLTINIGE